jgi:hypothetical protein
MIKEINGVRVRIQFRTINTKIRTEFVLPDSSVSSIVTKFISLCDEPKEIDFNLESERIFLYLDENLKYQLQIFSLPKDQVLGNNEFFIHQRKMYLISYEEMGVRVREVFINANLAEEKVFKSDTEFLGIFEEDVV